MEDSDPEAVRLRKRAKLVGEIIATEKTYVQHLTAVVEVFLKPLKERAMQPNPPCPADKLALIFSNIDQLLPLNQALLAAFEEATSGEASGTNLGQVIHKYAPFLKSYAPFINNYEKMIEVVEKQQKREEFARFLDEVRGDARCCGLNLQSLLITPVQRIPRYKLLFEELLKLTNHDDPEFGDIQKGLQTVNEVAHKVNKAVSEKERRDMLISIQQRFVGSVGILQPDRWFVREGSLQKVCRKGPKRFQFILFNDSLLYARTTVNGQLKLHRHIFLSSCKIADSPDKSLPNSFQILSKDKSFTVVTDNPQTKQDWLTDIQQLKKMLLENAVEKEGVLNQHSALSNSSSAPVLAPVWTPDKDVTKCPLCQSHFTVLRRRHHCRKCGTVVCGNCSTTGYRVVELSDKQVRLCNDCVSQSLGKSAAAPPRVDAVMLECMGLGPDQCFTANVWREGYHQSRHDQAPYDWDGYQQYMGSCKAAALNDEQANYDTVLFEVSYQAGYVQAGYDAFMESLGHQPLDNANRPTPAGAGAGAGSSSPLSLPTPKPRRLSEEPPRPASPAPPSPRQLPATPPPIALEPGPGSARQQEEGGGEGDGDRGVAIGGRLVVPRPLPPLPPARNASGGMSAFASARSVASLLDEEGDDSSDDDDDDLGLGLPLGAGAKPLQSPNADGDASRPSPVVAPPSEGRVSRTMPPLPPKPTPATPPPSIPSQSAPSIPSQPAPSIPPQPAPSIPPQPAPSIPPQPAPSIPSNPAPATQPEPAPATQPEPAPSNRESVAAPSPPKSPSSSPVVAVAASPPPSSPPAPAQSAPRANKLKDRLAFFEQQMQ